MEDGVLIMLANQQSINDDMHLITDILADHESLSLIVLYEKYLPLVINTIRQFQFRYYEFDDLKVDAMMVCYESVQEYDQQRNVTFGAFFKANLTNYFYTLLRNQSAQKRHLDLLTNSYEYLISTNGISSLGPDQKAIQPENIC